ncbi:hypothetical protein [Sorangium sp. So ce1078]|uniref:hypothetical protein n=1 Tax=Sorangium sp. So ce1078 TaxID=3133329 RepID=UPI003F5D571A
MRSPACPPACIRLGPAIALPLALLAASVAPARADTAARTYALSWSRLPGAEACVDARALALLIEERLRRAVFAAASRADISIEGRVEPAPGAAGFRAAIHVRDSRGALAGTRELASDDPSCATLGEQSALAIAVIIDPGAALDDAQDPSPPPSPSPSAAQRPAPPPKPAQTARPPAAPPPKEAPPPPRSEPPTHDHEHITTGFVVGAGMLPAPSYGVSVRGGARSRRYLGFELHGTLWFERELEQPAGQGARVSLAQAGLSLCPLWIADEAGSLLACAGVSAGALLARGFGFERVGRADRLTLDADLRGAGVYRIAGAWVAVVGLGLGAPMLRDALVYRDAGGAQRELFRMAPVTGRVELGLGLELP